MSTIEGGQTSRRGFLGTIASGAAAMGLATLTPLQQIHAETGFSSTDPDPEQVFKNLKGKHRAVFDVPKAEGIFPFAWPRIFLVTNIATGTPEKENSVVVVLRHDGIPYAFEDRLWAKYNFGEVFKLDDPTTPGKRATRNALWKPAPGTFKIPGFGVVPIGINELQDSGVQFVVCNAAMTVYSAAVADAMKLKAEDVYNDWKSGLLPGITPVPSGVWAVGRAQENKCAYIFAG